MWYINNEPRRYRKVGINMKTLKKAEQKNVVLNMAFYTSDEVYNMLLAHEIFYINKSYDICYSVDEYNNEILRVNIETGSELKVVLDEGYYTTVLVQNGKKYFVEL